MKIDVEVNRYFDHRTRIKADVPEGAVATQSDQGEEFARVREVHDEPSVTSIHVPDEVLDRMHGDHLDAIKNAAGTVPEKSRRRLLADHLTDVLGHHAPPGSVHKVHVLPDGARDNDQRKALEKFLNRVLVDEDDELTPRVEGDELAGAAEPEAADEGDAEVQFEPAQETAETAEEREENQA